MVAKRPGRKAKVHSLTIRDIPIGVLGRLRQRAEANRRSMQGEILAMLEEAAATPLKSRLSARQLLDHVRALGVQTPGESVAMIREDRDAR